MAACEREKFSDPKLIPADLLFLIQSDASNHIHQTANLYIFCIPIAVVAQIANSAILTSISLISEF